MTCMDRRMFYVRSVPLARDRGTFECVTYIMYPRTPVEDDKNLMGRRWHYVNVSRMFTTIAKVRKTEVMLSCFRLGKTRLIYCDTSTICNELSRVSRAAFGICPSCSGLGSNMPLVRRLLYQMFNPPSVWPIGRCRCSCCRTNANFDS